MIAAISISTLMFVASASSATLPAPADTPDRPSPSELPVHSEEVLVVGDGPLVAPVSPGEPVRIFFGAGELFVETGDVSEVRAEVELRCPPARRARCGDVHKRLRVKAKQTEEGVVVRVAGVRANILKRYDVTARLLVPRTSPLAVKAGFGAVRVEAGDRSVEVDMKIGDLRVFGREDAFSSASARVRIGDASVRAATESSNRRKMLIGARGDWRDSDDLRPISGGEHIRVKLRIGDARVILEDDGPSRLARWTTSR